jgi:hypothetical protein
MARTTRPTSSVVVSPGAAHAVAVDDVALDLDAADPAVRAEDPHRAAQEVQVDAARLVGRRVLRPLGERGEALPHPAFLGLGHPGGEHPVVVHDHVGVREVADLVELGGRELHVLGAAAHDDVDVAHRALPQRRRAPARARR